jgi:glyoxylate carboligase
MYCNTSKELWDEMKEMFGQDQNFAYIFHLKQITTAKQLHNTIEI